jgi:radical SAM protein with 4Fe4S-binding SPASM domain
MDGQTHASLVFQPEGGPSLCLWRLRDRQTSATVLGLFGQGDQFLAAIPQLNILRRLDAAEERNLRARFDPATNGALGAISSEDDDPTFAELLQGVVRAQGLVGTDKDAMDEVDVYHPGELNQIYIDVTSRCNLRCSYCYAGAELEASAPEPNLVDLTALAEACVRINPKILVVLSGGEPTLRPDLDEIVDIFTSRLRTQIFTNGTNLHRLTATMLKKLEAVCVSIHPGEVSDERVQKIIDVLRQYRTDGIAASVQVVMTPPNEERATAIVRRALAAGLSVKPNLCDPVGRCTEHKEDVYAEEQSLALVERLYNLAREPEAGAGHLQSFYVYNTKEGFLSDQCGLARTVVHVTPDGSVYPCSNLMDEAFRLGRVTPDHPLDTLLASAEFEQRMRALRAPIHNVPGCGDCAVRYACKGGCRAMQMFAARTRPDAPHPRCRLHQKEIALRAFAPAPGPSANERAVPSKAGCFGDPWISRLCENALRLVQPWVGRQRVEIAGLTVRQTPLNVEFTPGGLQLELPELVAAVRLLTEVLKYCEAHDQQGAVLAIDGFSPRQIEAFTIRLGRGASHYIGTLSSACDAECVFCYEAESPLPWRRGQAPAKNVRYRWENDRPDLGLSLAAPIRFALEPFVHTDCLNLIAELRSRIGREELAFQTNGTRLTADVVKRLAELGPIHLEVSLNAPTPESRARRMILKHEDHALPALRSLANHGIRFAVSIVAWPDLSFAELEDTVAVAEEIGAGHVALHFGSFHRWQPCTRTERLDVPHYWEALRDYLPTLRRQFRTPIMCTPASWVTPSITPVLEGVVRGSPADSAGLMQGDVIETVGGEPVCTKSDALDRFTALWPREPVALGIRRGQRRLALVVNNSGIARADDRAPYKPSGYLPVVDAGLCLSEDISSSSLLALADLLGQRRPKRPVLLSSALMAPQAARAIERFPSLQARFLDFDLDIITVENAYFGGNIMAGDLLTVGDHIRALHSLVRSGRDIDLAIVPSTFLCRFDQDLRGHSFRWIERATGVPVELLPCRRIAL